MGTALRSLGMTLVVSIAGCATAPIERAAQSRPTGEQVVTIEMVRFTFEPDVVTLKAGTPLKVTAASNSRIPHNITVLSLDGQVIKAVDIAARATETFEVTLPQPGRYVFYCDKFLHRWPFAMEGTLVAQ
jgi:plastocyanin